MTCESNKSGNPTTLITNNIKRHNPNSTYKWHTESPLWENRTTCRTTDSQVGHWPIGKVVHNHDLLWKHREQTQIKTVLSVRGLLGVSPLFNPNTHSQSVCVSSVVSFYLLCLRQIMNVQVLTNPHVLLDSLSSVPTTRVGRPPLGLSLSGYLTLEMTPCLTVGSSKGRPSRSTTQISFVRT